MIKELSQGILKFVPNEGGGGLTGGNGHNGRLDKRCVFRLE